MNHPLSDDEVDELIIRILADGVVSFPRHAWVAMDERGIDESDVRNVLRGGGCVGHRWSRGSYRYEVCTDRFVVVLVLRSEDELVVVTAWKDERPDGW